MGNGVWLDTGNTARSALDTLSRGVSRVNIPQLAWALALKLEGDPDQRWTRERERPRVGEQSHGRKELLRTE